jgi:hypothetical protein
LGDGFAPAVLAIAFGTVAFMLRTEPCFTVSSLRVSIDYRRREQVTGFTHDKTMDAIEAMAVKLGGKQRVIDGLCRSMEAICACYPKNSNAHRIAAEALAKARGGS